MCLWHINVNHTRFEYVHMSGKDFVSFGNLNNITIRSQTIVSLMSDTMDDAQHQSLSRFLLRLRGERMICILRSDSLF